MRQEPSRWRRWLSCSAPRAWLCCRRRGRLRCHRRACCRASRPASWNEPAGGSSTSLRCSQECPRTSRSEEHTSELQSHLNLVCRLLLEKKKNTVCAVVSIHCATGDEQI